MRSHRMKFVIFVLMIALLAWPGISMAAEGKIVIAQGAEQRAIDAHKGGSQMFVTTSLTLYDTLIRRGWDGKLEPTIATSWKIIAPDTWEFKIREGVRFHNGEPLTASDIKFSLDRMRDPATKYPMRTAFKTIVDVKVIDDYTVHVITDKPDPTLLSPLASTGFLVPEDYIKKHGDEYFAKHPIGSGRYKFVKWVQGDYIELEANENYWGEPATVKTLIFKVIPENGARVAALQTGEVDIATNIPPFLVSGLEKDKNIKIISGPSGRVIFIGMSLLEGQGAGPLLNKKVRQAMNYAVDKESIVKYVLMGSGRVLATPVVPASFGYDPTIEPYPYDPGKAKSLLSEAGYPNGFSTEMDTGSGRYLMDKQVAEAVVGMLGKVGIDVKLNVLEWGQYVKKRRSHTQAPLYLLGWGNTTFDADNPLGALFCINCTHSNYRNPDLVALVDEARHELNTEKRKAMYSKALRIIKEEAPWIFLYEQGDNYGVRTRVGNFYMPDGSETMYCDVLTIKE